MDIWRSELELSDNRKTGSARYGKTLEKQAETPNCGGSDPQILARRHKKSPISNAGNRAKTVCLIERPALAFSVLVKLACAQLRQLRGVGLNDSSETSIIQVIEGNR